MQAGDKSEQIKGLYLTQIAEDGLGASFSLEKEKDGEAVPASRGRIAFIFR